MGGKRGHSVSVLGGSASGRTRTARSLSTHRSRAVAPAGRFVPQPPAAAAAFRAEGTAATPSARRVRTPVLPATPRVTEEPAAGVQPRRGSSRLAERPRVEQNNALPPAVGPEGSRVSHMTPDFSLSVVCMGKQVEFKIFQLSLYPVK